MLKELRATKNGAKQTSQVLTKKRQGPTCGAQGVIANKTMTSKIKYVAGPANNVYTFG